MLVVVNPTAGLGSVGGGARARAELAAALAVAHGSAVEVVVTTQAGHARELASSAARRGARMVVAWGGDGTVNEVASSLAGSDTVLAVVPAGSGNGLARELNVPLDPRLAFDAAMAGIDRRIDLGSLDGRSSSTWPAWAWTRGWRSGSPRLAATGGAWRATFVPRCGRSCCSGPTT